MIAPPSVTEANERRKLVSKKRERIQAKASSSNATVITAAISAARYCGIRNGSVCRIPPANVPAPVMAPRRYGLAATGQIARVGETLGERHAHAGPDRRCEPGEERVAGLVGGERDGEDRRQGRERAVDQPGHRGLHALEEK